MFSKQTTSCLFLAWDHWEFKVWVIMKLVPYGGVLIKEYVGEILKSFDKFQVVPSSMKVFTTNLNGPLSPMVSRPSEGRAGRDTLAPARRLLYISMTNFKTAVSPLLVHCIRDSYSTFIRRVIGPSKNSMELFFNSKFDFKSTWNCDSTTAHHKHPVCQFPARDAEKLTNVWSRYFGTNRIVENWHWCLG